MSIRRDLNDCQYEIQENVDTLFTMNEAQVDRKKKILSSLVAEMGTYINRLHDKVAELEDELEATKKKPKKSSSK